MTPEEREKEKEAQMAKLEAWLEAVTEYTAAHPGSVRIGRCMTRDSIFLVWVANGQIVAAGPSMHWN